MKRNPDWQEQQLERIAITFLVSSLLALRAAGVWASSEPEPIRIYLPASYEVTDTSATVVTIGDLAESIAGGSPEERRTLSAIPVMRVPDAGQSLRCSTARMLAAVRMHGFQEYGRLRFEGLRTFTVYGPGQTISRESLVDRIVKDIMDEFGWGPEELSVEIVSFPHRLRVPPGKLDIRTYRTSPHRYGPVQYDLTILIDNREFLHRKVIVDIGHRRDVFVFRRSKRAGSFVTLQDVEVQTRYIRSEREDRYTVSDPRELIGRKLARSVNRGIVVTRDLFTRTYLLPRGKTVNIIVRSGGIRVDVRGRAMQNGNIGDVIRVKNLFNNTIARARVVDTNTVELL